MTIFDRHPQDEAMRRVHEQLAAAAANARRRERDAIEKVLLRALAGGRHGVLVTTRLVDGLSTEVAEISPQVPYGRIAYVPIWSNGLFDRALDLEPASADELRIITAYLARKLACDDA